MAQTKLIDVTVLEPLEITGWKRKHPETVAKKATNRKVSKPKAGRGVHRKKNAKVKRRQKPSARKPRRPAPWPKAAATMGVYGIYHRPSNSIYIGYTADKNGFKWRWKRHKAQLFVAKTHHCAILQEFVNKQKLHPKDFELIILSSYPARPRTQNYAI